MKRKTNLFYNVGQDSNFVTFSNYTEALTGNILATNAKMFPSKFICVYVPKLAGLVDPTDINNTLLDNPYEGFNFNDVKQNFIINYLSSYYENKLAFLRDWCIENDEKIEDKLKPLLYLIHCLQKYDNKSVISFIGDICEQDFNGTFMDNICIIENNAKSFDISLNDIIESIIQSSNDMIEYDESMGDSLYGWANKTMPAGYEFAEALFDIQANKEYSFYDNAGVFDYTHGQSNNIKFNILIPLFDIHLYDQLNHVHTKPESDVNSCLIKEHKEEDEIILDNSDLLDIPMGIWFSDKVIELERQNIEEANNSLYNPSWSLCVSSQFKPFPFGTEYPNEISQYANPDKFASFAMIMAKQSFILNEFDNINVAISSLNDKLNRIENVISVNKYYQNYNTSENSENQESNNENNNNNGNSNVNDEDIQEINTKINSIYTTLSSINTEIGSLRTKTTNMESSYVDKTDLGNQLSPMGYITDADISNLKSDFNTLKNNFGGVNDNNIIQKINNTIDLGNSAYMKRFKAICNFDSTKTTSWYNTGIFAGETIYTLKDPCYAIPNIVTAYQNIITSYEAANTNIITSYEAADTTITNELNNLHFRVNVLDGLDQAGQGGSAVVPNLNSAMSLVETKLSEIAAVITYLYGQLPVLNGLSNEGSDQVLRTILNNISNTNAWSEIYAGNNQDNNSGTGD